MNTLEEADKYLHAKDSLNPAYVLGFNSKKEDKNPFIFPEELDIARIKIGSIPRPLTEDERNELRRLGDIADNDPWQCWGMGHYRKWRDVD